jgi:hypothetical protein
MLLRQKRFKFGTTFTFVLKGHNERIEGEKIRTSQWETNPSDDAAVRSSVYRGG